MVTQSLEDHGEKASVVLLAVRAEALLPGFC